MESSVLVIRNLGRGLLPKTRLALFADFLEFSFYFQVL